MDIRQLLTETVYMKASDLHLCPGQPPKIRVNGDIINLNSTALDKETIEQMLEEVTNEKQLQNMKKHLDLDF